MTFPVSAQEESAAAPHPIHVDWFQPQFIMTIGKKRARVFLTGQTQPGSKITVSGPLILLNKNKTIRVPYEKAAVQKEVFADERGYFDLPLDLTFNAFQVPVQVTNTTGESRLYILPIVVMKRDVSVADQLDLANSPFGRRTWSFWAGTGMNYLIYEQDNQTIGSALELNSFHGPSFYLKATRTINRQVALSATYNRSPGKTVSSDSIRVLQNEFVWSFYTAEANYFPPSWKRRSFGKYFTEIGAQLGFQEHLVPFMARADINDPSSTSVTKNNLTMLAGGLTFLMHYNRYFLFEGFGRYQYPIRTGSLFDIKPKFALDGSVGVIYKWKKDFRIGGFWYGQWHKYDFTNHHDLYFDANPLDGTNPTNGSQTLFFTNLELRLGWEFD